MPKVCLFNSAESTDSEGKPFSAQVRLGAANPSYSKPLRLFAGDGEVRYASYEFILSGAAVSDWVLYFWFEYWADDIVASLAEPPTVRKQTDLNQNVPWNREQDEIVGAAGAVSHNDVVRDMTFTIAGTGRTEVGDAKFLPVLHHAPWVRIAFYAAAALPAENSLRISAIIGGHSEAEYLDTYDHKPYAYNA